MSIRGSNYYSSPDVAAKTLTAGLAQYPNNPGYQRPADWPALPAIPDGTQKVYVLIMVSPGGGNYAAFSATGNYTVDWGDGTSDSVSSGATITHTYDYNNVNLSAVTTRGYKCATATITPTGAANLTVVNFNVKPVITGLGAWNQPWLEIYMNVPNLTTFGLGGNTIRIDLLEQITIQQNNITAWSNQFLSHLYALQQVVFLKSSPVPFAANSNNLIFTNAFALKWIYGSGAAPGTATSLQSAFAPAASLIQAPFIDTPLVTTTNLMFNGCYALKQVPLYNTANVTNMASMFQDCRSLPTVPLLNTNKVTTMASMFQNCYSLASVPTFDTANVTDMSSMFNTCYSLNSVPAFNTASANTMASMFNTCYNLTQAPNLNTAKVISMASMFAGCQTLQTVPAYNTGNVTTMNAMFNGCFNLAVAPAFTDTSKVTDVTSMFTNNYALKSVPSYNLANAVTGGTSMLTNCQSLADFNGYNINQNFTLPAAALSASAAGNILANLSIKSAVANTITLALNPGIPASVAVTGVTSTAGNARLTMSNTTGLVVGMTAISANINSGIATVANTGNNAITLTSHNLTNNTIVSFSTAVFTVGTAYTPLYVVNATTNTFQVANTIGGSALTVSANATPVVNYGRYIANIVANTSVTVSPCYASNTGNGTVNFRTFDTTIATLKNWTVSG